MAGRRLTQETIQIPEEHKQEAIRLADALGYYRAGEPSRSRVYQLMILFALENIDGLLEWNDKKVHQKIKGGTAKR